MNDLNILVFHIFLGGCLGFILFWYFLFSTLESKTLLQRHKRKIYILLFASLATCFVLYLTIDYVHEGRATEKNNADLIFFLLSAALGMLSGYVLLKARKWGFYEEIKDYQRVRKKSK